MSRNKLTEEQYKKAFDELQASKDTFDALERLADDFNTTPKGLKIGLQRKYPNDYSNWFPLIVKRGDGPTKAELMKKLLEEAGIDNVDWLVDRSMKSPLPNEVIDEIIQKLEQAKKDKQEYTDYHRQNQRDLLEAMEKLHIFETDGQARKDLTWRYNDRTREFEQTDNDYIVINSHRENKGLLSLLCASFGSNYAVLIYGAYTSEGGVWLTITSAVLGLFQ